ncbi:MAG TPA: hypothetical protein VFM88_10050 [Vicinamibacteria bacterium]|nr:hypothetical protein [Vicinamibacteria bacterium]
MATADTLAPTAFVVLETLVWLHLVPAILLIETFVARRVLALSWPRSSFVTIAANVASAAVGLPLTSLLAARGLRSIGHPAGDSALLALIELAVPCFFVSVWVELLVAERLVPPDRRSSCRRWSLEANLASYLAIEGVLLALYASVGIWRSRGWIP